MGGDHSTASFTALADLASARVGGRAVATNDDFFASKSNLVRPEPAIFIAGKFTARGKWMDGWESRRRRTPGHDWCVVQLGLRGVLHGVNVDTRFFTGNFPSHCSIDAVDLPGAHKLVTGSGTETPQIAEISAYSRRRDATRSLWSAEGVPWTPILAKSELHGDSDNFLAMDGRRPWTHVRLNIFPDGGVARLRVFGEAAIDWNRVAQARRTLDLASILNGGLVLSASDMHYGARDNLIMPGRAKNMGDGWETRRRRGPGYDWAIVRLGTSGAIVKLEIDTNHFKGNYPDRASVDGCHAPGASLDALAAARWNELLPQTKLRASHRHLFAKELRRIGPVSHVRLNIYPDGGISRLRVHGTVAPR